MLVLVVSDDGEMGARLRERFVCEGDECQLFAGLNGGPTPRAIREL